MIELGPRAYGTHSLRRTKVALIYKKTGNLRACQLLLGHRKQESTVRYLGIEVDDPLRLVPADRNLTVLRSAWRTEVVRQADVVRDLDG